MGARSMACDREGKDGIGHDCDDMTSPGGTREVRKDDSGRIEGREILHSRVLDVLLRIGVSYRQPKWTTPGSRKASACKNRTVLGWAWLFSEEVSLSAPANVSISTL